MKLIQNTGDLLPFTCAECRNETFEAVEAKNGYIYCRPCLEAALQLFPKAEPFPLKRTWAIMLVRADRALSVRKIAAEVGVDEKTVRQWIKKAGLSPRPYFLSVQREQAIALKRADPALTNVAIAQELGVHTTSVADWLNAEGLNTRRLAPQKAQAIALKKANPALSLRAISLQVGVSWSSVHTWLNNP
jgi:DNA-binding transcriptional regulator YdaS (Cro superfamily)